MPLNGRNQTGRTQSYAGPYYHHLQSFWNGRIDATVKAVGDTLANEPYHRDAFKMYRLWIECLAKTRDMKALHSLAEHLLLRASELDAVTCASLRGLIHLERDEFSAARILARRCGSELTNLYAQELLQAVQARKHHNAPMPLTDLVSETDDYIVLDAICRQSLHRKNNELLDAAFDAAHKYFPQSPLEDFYMLHREAENNETQIAASHAEKLTKQFPQNADFAFFAGHLAFRRNQFEEAKNHLERAAKLADSDDPDVTTLLGHTYRELARRDRNNTQNYRDKAIRHLERATSVLKSAGYPVAQTEFRLNVLKADENEKLQDLDNLSPSKLWLVKVSARRYHELCTSRPEDIEVLRRPMGATPKPHDLVIFAADHSSYAENDRRARARSWKIAAIYAVESEPIWHPQHRCESVLRLITLPTVPIAVDVADFTPTKKSKNKLSKDHHVNFGVYEIEAGALDIIAEAVAQKQGQWAGEWEEEPLKLRMIS